MMVRRPEVLVVLVLGGGRLSLARCGSFLLSDTHAALLGEASIVFHLSQTPVLSEVPSLVIAQGSGLPWSVYASVAIYGVIGLVLSVWGLRWILVWRRSSS